MWVETTGDATVVAKLSDTGYPIEQQ